VLTAPAVATVTVAAAHGTPRRARVRADQTTAPAEPPAGSVTAIALPATVTAWTTTVASDDPASRRTWRCSSPYAGTADGPSTAASSTHPAETAGATVPAGTRSRPRAPQARSVMAPRMSA
jgi:hypothetical protein